MILGKICRPAGTQDYLRNHRYYLNRRPAGTQLNFGASDGKVWRCDRSQDTAGYAINDIRYRFKNPNGCFPWLTEEFFFHNSWDNDISDYMLSHDYLDFKVAFQLPAWNRDIAHPINMLKFEVFGRPWVQNGEYTEETHD